MDEISWEEAEEMFELFTVWHCKPEMRWFEYVWRKFAQLGLTNYADQNERQLVLVRLVTLGIMYQEFCQKAFDEICDDDSMYGEVYHWEDGFDPIRLGTMVDREYIGPDSDKWESFNEAIAYLVYKNRLSVYDHLVKAFGDPTELLVSLWLSMDEDVPIGQYPEDLYDCVVNCEVTGNKLDAFQYVESGMISLGN